MGRLQRWLLPAALALLASGCIQMVDRSQFSIDRGDQAPAAAAAVQHGQVTGLRMVGGVYDGSVRNGVPDGSGSFRFEDGRRYEGGFAAGRLSGSGRMAYPDGRVVTGQYSADAEEAVSLAYPDGRVFEGRVVQGTPQGKGTMRNRDGSSIAGQFQGGQAVGRGLYTAPDGGQFFGPMANNLPQGNGICSRNGSSSSCDRKGNTDVTAQALKQEGEARAKRAMEQGQQDALSDMQRQADARLDPLEAERNKLRRQVTREGGPTRDGDFSCWCAIASLCLTVTDANDRTPAEVHRMQEEKRRLTCRNKYADWLQIKAQPDFNQRIAELNNKLAQAQQRVDAENAAKRQRQREIEAEWARRKADKEAMDRLREAEAAKERAEREKQLEEKRNRCRKPEVRRANPCSCAAALNEKLKPGGVCEA